MPDQPKEHQNISRRRFLEQMWWAPVLLLPAPLMTPLFRSGLQRISSAETSPLTSADVRFTPHYPTKSPLDDILRLAAPGTDEYVVEGYASELRALLEKWSQQLRAEFPALATISGFVDLSIQSTALTPIHESPLRPGH